MSISAIGGGAAASPYAATAPSATSLTASPLTKKPDAVADFMSWAKMTPAQRMRANVLAGMGLSEADLAAMSPKDRAAAEKKIADKIKTEVQQSTEQKTGVLADIKA